MDEQIKVVEKPKSKIWLVLIVVVLVIVAVVIFLKKPQSSKDDGPPLLIKNLPINLAPYDAATGMAGDLKFTQEDLQFNTLYMDFAFEIPASPDFPSKKNPQPTFIAPLGTKVRSMVDGTVAAVGKLYSDDYSIAVSDGKSQYMYETEHVKNPLVEVGDTVKAGDVIAEVSDFSGNAKEFGLGMVEMGILKGGNPPSHLCPFLYLDPAVKDKITNDIKTLYTDWNIYKGKTIYDLSVYKTIGCLDEEGSIEDNNDSTTGRAAN